MEIKNEFDLDLEFKIALEQMIEQNKIISLSLRNNKHIEGIPLGFIDFKDNENEDAKTLLEFYVIEKDETLKDNHYIFLAPGDIIARSLTSKDSTIVYSRYSGKIIE